MDGISTVHGRYYQLSSDYHQINGQHALYYRDALRYLGCTDLDEINGMLMTYTRTNITVRILTDQQDHIIFKYLSSNKNGGPQF